MQDREEVEINTNTNNVRQFYKKNKRPTKLFKTGASSCGAKRYGNEMSLEDNAPSPINNDSVDIPPPSYD